MSVSIRKASFHCNAQSPNVTNSRLAPEVGLNGFGTQTLLANRQKQDAEGEAGVVGSFCWLFLPKWFHSSVLDRGVREVCIKRRVVSTCSVEFVVGVDKEFGVLLLELEDFEPFSWLYWRTRLDLETLI